MGKIIELRTLLKDLIPLGEMSVEFYELNHDCVHEKDVASYNEGYSDACKSIVTRLDKIIGE